ncbi:hypothetical protein [Ideonella azotifigens]|uniref:hypothetical protein n=1 Tax=Ideonella azotifigens TaxID=513160 RepID=UPI0014774714|nr:hypothetical protein [Ideonella azotifigens]
MLLPKGGFVLHAASTSDASASAKLVLEGPVVRGSFIINPIKNQTEKFGPHRAQRPLQLGMLLKEIRVSAPSEKAL